jgi:hypothetical protein
MKPDEKPRGGVMSKKLGITDDEGRTDTRRKQKCFTLSAGVKRPGREADHSPPTNAEVKKTWIYTSLLTYGAEPFLRSRQLCSH